MSPLPPIPDAFNLADYVLTAGRLTPEKTALSLVDRDGAENWTYAQIDTAVHAAATAMQAAGLKSGDRIVLRIGNEVAFPIAFLGAILVGIIPVPTSVGLTQNEINKVANAVRPKMVVASHGIALPDNVPVLKAADVLAARPSENISPDLGNADRPAYIILTSGTSGTPRLVVHAHRAIWARRYMWNGWYGLTANDRVAHAGAFNWTYTLGTGLMDPWTIGATALIPKPGQSPRELPELLRLHKATIFAAAPGIFRQMLRGQSRLDLPALRHGLTAGEKCPTSTQKSWQNLTGTQLHEAFGQSEISTFISGSPARPAPADTLGYPQPGRRVAIVDQAGKVQETGTPGTIAVHRDDPGLMLHLFEDPIASRERFAGAWYLTGDSGQSNEDGSITYLGRSDDMLNAGGFRVSPLEVEQALCEFPSITEAAAVDTEIKKDTIVIALHYAAAQPIGDTELSAFAQSRLAPYKCPRIYVHHDHLPRNPNGKLLRRALRKG